MEGHWGPFEAQLVACRRRRSAACGLSWVLCFQSVEPCPRNLCSNGDTNEIAIVTSIGRAGAVDVGPSSPSGVLSGESSPRRPRRVGLPVPSTILQARLASPYAPGP